MSEHIVGMMWNKNEGDIIHDTISSALENVDTLVIADDGSTDKSWDTIQGFAAAHKDQIEHIQRAPNANDPAQRQSLLDVIRSRYRAEDTWVQVIESDIMILETDIRKATKERAQNDMYVNWATLNAVIDPALDWDAFDTWPVWDKPIQDILTHGHFMEKMTYTYRPFKELFYDTRVWRPWPKGFTKVAFSDGGPTTEYIPILAHYGYRGPTHLHKKYFPTIGAHPCRYPTWDYTSPETVKETVWFFNGEWNGEAHKMSREAYLESRLARERSRYGGSKTEVH